jgi:hypothetical protein
MLEKLSNNQLVVTLVALAVPVIIAKVYAWLKKEARESGNAEYVKAVEALKVGVEDAWNSHVKEWKAKAEGGKLTQDQKDKAQHTALSVARNVAKDVGINLDKALGGKLTIAMKIAEIVRARKRRRREKKQG